MELWPLRYFLTTVSEEYDINRAAGKRFLARPARSRQINTLEKEIGLCSRSAGPGRPG